LSVDLKYFILLTLKKESGSFFLLGVVIYVISDHKSNDLLLLLFAPLAIMAKRCNEGIPQRKKIKTKKL
jgi:hypothetical protein